VKADTGKGCGDAVRAQGLPVRNEPVAELQDPTDLLEDVFGAPLRDRSPTIR
jgi:hypothetical protein